VSAGNFSRRHRQSTALCLRWLQVARALKANEGRQAGRDENLTKILSVFQACDRQDGIRWTIKNGIAYDAIQLMADTAAKVEKQRKQ
jgi:hypothetical protein